MRSAGQPVRSAENAAKRPADHDGTTARPVVKEARFVSLESCAQQLLDLEDGLPWNAVKQSWMYKQKKWLDKVTDFLSGQAQQGGLAPLIQDIQRSIKPAALPAWFSVASATWTSRLHSATDNATLSE
eukprot:2314296-Prymnesium_polylepis.1